MDRRTIENVVIKAMGYLPEPIREEEARGVERAKTITADAAGIVRMLEIEGALVPITAPAPKAA